MVYARLGLIVLFTCIPVCKTMKTQDQSKRNHQSSCPDCRSHLSWYRSAKFLFVFYIHFFKVGTPMVIFPLPNIAHPALVILTFSTYRYPCVFSWIQALITGQKQIIEAESDAVLDDTGHYRYRYMYMYISCIFCLWRLVV